MKLIPEKEETLVILKPDCVADHKVGQTIAMLEAIGLTIVQARMVNPTKRQAEKHITTDQTWLSKLGDITLNRCAETDHDPIHHFGSRDSLEVGIKVRQWIVNFMLSGPVIVMILTGEGAIERTRSIIGHTVPKLAKVGTIRRDLFGDSPDLMEIHDTAGCNGIHASDSRRSYIKERRIWFPDYQLKKAWYYVRDLLTK